MVPDESNLTRFYGLGKGKERETKDVWETLRKGKDLLNRE